MKHDPILKLARSNEVVQHSRERRPHSTIDVMQSQVVWFSLGFELHNRISVFHLREKKKKESSAKIFLARNFIGKKIPMKNL